MLLSFTQGCAAEDGADGSGGDTEAPDSGTSGSDGIVTHLPPPVAYACGAGEIADDQFCVTSCLADADPIANGLQVECAATEIGTDAAGRTTETEMLPCDPGGVLPPGAAMCVDVRMDTARSAECINDDWPVEIVVVRADPSQVGCRIEPRCRLSQNRAIDCPGYEPPPDVCGDAVCALGEGCGDCPIDCGACSDYASCDAQADCGEPTPYCAAPPLFENGGGMCTVACDEFHPCPEFAETGTRAACMDGMCVLECDNGDPCPTGMGCVDLGPIAPGGNVLVCMP
ncbi:MAG: hypothetical protein IPH07_30235 [Deltaproteobacteria bacterium]|nr:hypothetical protein [Deltaproteobacteria bacterium]MBK8715194.1 hypothetical protein [Deltaproteobacteria bacterium]MBP7285100.1 hypothetical protein [Nannocystaceae bacterium]